jgi:beta-N-acetylhexosaminidase
MNPQVGKVTASIAAIVGIAGTVLTDDEAALFREHPPAGVILFARNIAEPAALRRLVVALRRTLPADAVLMVDQEGGRVARLTPPHWRAHPPAAAHGALFAANPSAGLRAAWLTGALIGLDCAGAGFDVVTAPVLDRRLPGAHGVIGDRAFAAEPHAVAALGRAMADGLLAAGVQPVGKHVPGHGRARVDSHLELPVVTEADLSADWAPFAANADLPWMMTAHVSYPALDPKAPATLSARILGGVVRRRIGFRGVLVSDDLGMQALAGAPAERALAALAAGCDVALYCSGVLSATAGLLARCPPLTEAALARLAAARALAASRRQELDGDALASEQTRLLT